MKRITRIVTTLSMLSLATFAQQPANEQAKLSKQASPSFSASTERIVKEVRHEILSIPQYGVFDFLSFSVNGATVTLSGDVKDLRGTLCSTARFRGCLR